MYASYFGLKDNPFSITPDPTYLYMSMHHQEALAHLLYGTGEHGGFVQLTGEVGTGKTTLIRTLLQQQIENLDVALCLNPKLTVEEFMASICDELNIQYPKDSASLKPMIDALNGHLLHTHAQGRRTVLIIDEAQNLSHEVLEQVRLLTNLETHRHKLLRIILVGQPELQDLLARQDLRQLAQRITARYHLMPLTRKESAAYILHRLQVAGGRGDLFTRKALRSAYRLSCGVPRVINIICDRALLGAYVRGLDRVDAGILGNATREALQGPRIGKPRPLWSWLVPATVLAFIAIVGAGFYLQHPGTIGLLSVSEIPAKLTTALYTPFSTPSDQPPEAVHPIPDQSAEIATIERPVPALPVTAQTPTGSAGKPVQPATETAKQTVLVAADPYQQLLDWLSTMPTTDAAMGQLLASWGEAIPDSSQGTLCEVVQNRSLYCLQGQGDWHELRRHNRPVILYLTGQEQTQPVFMRSLVGEIATLELGDQPLQINSAALEQLWNGEYLMLWRLQTSYHLIGPGSWGEPVQWLRERLAIVEGESETFPLNMEFDGALAERVRHFQRANELEPDGIVGARTMVLLNNLAPGPGTPLLISPAREGA